MGMSRKLIYIIQIILSSYQIIIISLAFSGGLQHHIVGGEDLFYIFYIVTSVFSLLAIIFGVTDIIQFKKRFSMVMVISLILSISVLLYGLFILLCLIISPCLSF